MKKSEESSIVPLQFELFDSWFATPGEVEHSRTLAFWDVIPWRLLSHKRNSKLPEVIVFEGVKISEDREATVSLTPAILRSQPGTKDAMVIFPGVREELIERALRKLAVHKLASLQVQPNATDQGTAVTIVFSLHQLRQELEQTGHGFNLAQIGEGLEVMHLCNVSVECSGDSIVHKKKGPILPTLEIVADPADEDGKRMLYRASFHPLASAAILGELYFPVNYTRVMTLTQPLARWITNLLNNRFRYATKGIGEKKRSFRLTLKRILSDSGMRPEPRIRDNIARVRSAITELREAGFLDLGVSVEDIEKLKMGRTAGRAKIIDAEWELFPSNRFAGEIIEGNRTKKMRSLPAKET